MIIFGKIRKSDLLHVKIILIGGRRGRTHTYPLFPLQVEWKKRQDCIKKKRAKCIFKFCVCVLMYAKLHII